MSQQHPNGLSLVLEARGFKEMLVANPPSTKQVVHRSAVDGQFITRREAQQNPRESVRETVRIPASKPAPPKKR